MQAQARICPICYDDHSAIYACENDNLLESIATRDAEIERKDAVNCELAADLKDWRIRFPVNDPTIARRMVEDRARTFGDLGPVFLNANGARWDEANFGRSWRRLQKKTVAAGIRPLRFHDARHTFATWALESGKSIKWVQAMLGHSSPELTLRTYAHLMRAEGDEMGFLEEPGLLAVEGGIR